MVRHISISIFRKWYPPAYSPHKNKDTEYPSVPLPFCFTCFSIYYIIPPMPAPAGAAGTSSLIVPTTASVVRSVDATLDAF